MTGEAALVKGRRLPRPLQDETSANGRHYICLQRVGIGLYRQEKQYIMIYLFSDIGGRKYDILLAAVFTPHKDDKGFHVVFRMRSAARRNGPGFGGDAVENAEAT